VYISFQTSGKEILKNLGLLITRTLEEYKKNCVYNITSDLTTEVVIVNNNFGWF